MSDGNCKEKTSGETQHPQDAARVAKHFVACDGAASGPRARQAGRAPRRPILPYRGGTGAPVHRLPISRRRQKGGRRAHRRSTPDGTWDTAGWLISKDLAHIERGQLVPDTVDARKVLSALGVTPRHVGGDR